MPPKKTPARKTSTVETARPAKKLLKKPTEKPAKKLLKKPTEKPAEKLLKKPLKKVLKKPEGASENAPARRASGTRPKTAEKKPLRAKSPMKKPGRPVLVPAEAQDPTEARRDKTREIAKWAAIAAIDKKAERIEIIDLADKVDYADFFVLMTGRSDRQTQAIAQGITEALTARGIELKGTEGMSEGNWVLLDFGDVVAHVFLDESRKLYDLEGAWMDARRISYEGAALPSLPPRSSE